MMYMKKIREKMIMKSGIGRLFVIIFFVLLFLPMLLANYSKNVSSEIDNKRLTEFPQFGQEGFNDRLEQYVEDRVGLRVPAITLYQYLCDRLFHVLVHPAYMYGKGNEVYSPVDMTAYQNLDVEDKYIESVSDYLTGLADLCGDSNAEMIFFMCPNKESVYYENFPEGYNIKDQPDRSDRIVEELTEKGIHCVFPRDTYKKQRENILLYNHKYDVLHWNDTGCFYGMKELINEEKKLGYSVGELTAEEFDISEKTEKYLDQSRFIINDAVPDYKLRDDDITDNKEMLLEKYDFTDRNQYSYYFINSDHKERPRVFVIGDSYFGNSVASDSLKKHSSELLMVHIRNMDHIKEYITDFHPDVVVIEAVEREFINTGYWSPETVSEWVNNL